MIRSDAIQSISIRTVMMSSLLFLGGCMQSMQSVHVSADGHSFQLGHTNATFYAWGHNYGHAGALLCDFWIDQFPQIEREFRYAKQSLHANVLRIHLDTPKFMRAPDRVDPVQLAQLGKLLKLAEREQIYLDITGLACYRTADVPKWYDALDESHRWAAQATFWEAIANECRDSPAVFCYDLMNEPISPGDKRTDGKWYTGEFGGFSFIQFITLDPTNRKREDIAIDWIHQMKHAIRKHDTQHMITVGQLPWDKKWGQLSGFMPERVAKELDFISVHIYPERGKVQQAIEGLRKFEVGNPVVIEETFPLACSADELRQFIEQTRNEVNGFIGHFGGETIEELERKKDVPRALMRSWLILSRDMAPIAK
ncbi:MAG TPA: cellulase family glycosylhydrolase [Tepidisphaeraceae bacterium]|jgi:hypothetical protein|nr:cellulase family glycosylhydrolase [Tepidisphaeraceae bacterium]